MAPFASRRPQHIWVVRKKPCFNPRPRAVLSPSTPVICRRPSGEPGSLTLDQECWNLTVLDPKTTTKKTSQYILLHPCSKFSKSTVAADLGSRPPAHGFWSRGEVSAQASRPRMPWMHLARNVEVGLVKWRVAPLDALIVSRLLCTQNMNRRQEGPKQVSQTTMHGKLPRKVEGWIPGPTS